MNVSSAPALVAADQDRLYLDCARALEDIGIEARRAVTTDEAEGLASRGPWSVVLASIGPPGACFGFLDLAGRLNPRAARVVIASEPLRVFFDQFMPESMDCAVLALRRGLDTRELQAAIMRRRDPDPFGPAFFLQPGSPRLCLSCRESRQRGDVLDAVSRQSAKWGASRRLAGRAAEIAEEFLMNALYDAPEDADGARLFHHLPRSTPVVLPGEDRASISVSADDRRVGIAVSDPYGSLDRGTLRRYMSKYTSSPTALPDSKSGGAGLGIVKIIRAADTLSVTLVPGRRTEFVALLDRQRASSAAHLKSFHFVERTATDG